MGLPRGLQLSRSPARCCSLHALRAAGGVRPPEELKPMTIFIGPGGKTTGDLASELARLESLLVDLERIGSGQMPSEEDLAKAPLLHPWGISTTQHLCLFGKVEGHPILRGPRIRTTEIWLLAPKLGWARTLSRYYRLGDPIKPEAINER